MKRMIRILTLLLALMLPALAAGEGESASPCDLPADETEAPEDSAESALDAVSGIGAFHIIVDGFRYDGSFAELRPFGVTLWLHTDRITLSGVRAAEVSLVRLDPGLYPSDAWRMDIAETEDGSGFSTTVTAVPVGSPDAEDAGPEAAADEETREAGSADAETDTEENGAEYASPDKDADADDQQQVTATRTDLPDEDADDGPEESTAVCETSAATITDPDGDAAPEEECATATDLEEDADPEECATATDLDETADPENECATATDLEEDADPEECATATDLEEETADSGGTSGRKKRSSGKTRGSGGRKAKPAGKTSAAAAEGMARLIIEETELPLTIKAEREGETALFVPQTVRWEGESTDTLILTRTAGDGAVTWTLTLRACEELADRGYGRLILLSGEQAAVLCLPEIACGSDWDALRILGLDPGEMTVTVSMGGDADGPGLILTVAGRDWDLTSDQDCGLHNGMCGTTEQLEAYRDAQYTSGGQT